MFLGKETAYEKAQRISAYSPKNSELCAGQEMQRDVVSGKGVRRAEQGQPCVFAVLVLLGRCRPQWK